MKKALLLGEAPNSKLVHPNTWETVEAFDPIPGSSGFWLHRTLKSWILEDWKFDLENAVTLHRVEHKLHTYDVVVALSTRIGCMLQVPSVPHPAYWKRFHSKRPCTWAWMLYKKLVEGLPNEDISPRFWSQCARVSNL